MQTFIILFIILKHYITKKSWLATKPACSLVDDASLGPRVPPSGSGCPRLPVSGGGWAGPQLASSVQSFVLCVGLAVFEVSAFCGVATPQSGLLSQVSSLRLPSGHSGPVLTLSNAARASLPSPRLLVADAVSVLLLCCGSYCWARNLWVLIIYLFFPSSYVALCVPRLATDSAVRVFPGVWKLLF